MRCLLDDVLRREDVEVRAAAHAPEDDVEAVDVREVDQDLLDVAALAPGRVGRLEPGTHLRRDPVGFLLHYYARVGRRLGPTREAADEADAPGRPRVQDLPHGILVAYC